MNQVLLGYLPAFVRRRLEGRHDLQKIIGNTGWLFVDKIIRMGVGLFVGVWVARYLGPNQFGLFSYVEAFVTLFGTIATLGLNLIVVRDIVQNSDCAKETLGTTLVLQLLGGITALLLAIGVILLMRPADAFIQIMVVILGFVLVLKATDVVKYWFESQVQSRYAVWVENGAFIVMAAVKVAMIKFNAPLMAFAWAALAEAALVATGLLSIYAVRVGSMTKWQVRWARAKSLLKGSWTLVLSGVAVIIYMRIDQVMLGQMLGDEAVGVYTAAARISEVWYFIPITIVASVFPSLIEAKKQSETLYCQRFQKLYDLMVLLSVAVAIAMTFLSDWVVELLFGKMYEFAGTVLSIHIWSGVFVSLFVASGKWLLVENLQSEILFRHASGAAINILLNLILIPKYEINGAAIATLASYFFVTVLSGLFSKRSRPMVKSTVRSLLFVSSFKTIYRLIRGKPNYD